MTNVFLVSVLFFQVSFITFYLIITRSLALYKYMRMIVLYIVNGENIQYNAGGNKGRRDAMTTTDI